MAFKILNPKALKQYKPSEFEKKGNSYYLKEGVKPKIGTTQFEEAGLKNPNISKAKNKPNETANSAFINAVYQEKFGRKATEKEIIHFQEKGASVKEVSDTVLREKSIFTNPLNEPKSTVGAGTKAGTAGAGAGGGTGAGATGGGGTGGGTSGVTDPALVTILDGMTTILDSLKEKGQTVNPDIEITPKKTAEFMKQAEGEIDPYYAGQLKFARENLLTSFGYGKDDLEKFESGLDRKYGFAQKAVASSAVERGFAQSGVRQQEEGELVYDTQGQIDETRRGLGRRSEELAGAFARQYSGMAGFDQPNKQILEAPIVGIEGFKKSTAEKPLYQLSPDLYQNLIGSEEYNRRTQVSGRASELERAFRSSEALKQNKTLTL